MSPSRLQRLRSRQISRACFETLEVRQLMSFSPATSFPVGTNPQAVARADFNNDGKLDLATSNYDDATGDGTVSVLLGNASASFQPAQTSATGPDPVSLAAGDFNADGNLDLATANYGGYWDNDPVSILLGQGDGTFAAPVGVSTYGESPNSVATGDMNGDGKLDLVVATGQLYGTVSVLLGHGDGTFADAQPSDDYVSIFHSATLADFNGDGTLDVATVTYEGNSVAIFLGYGNGNLQEPRGFATGIGGAFVGPTSLAAGDFNADGKIDLATTSSNSNNVSLLLGQGNGNFQTAQLFAAGNAPQSATASDVNGDGKFDLVVANPSSTSSPGSVSVLLGNGNGSLGQPITTATSATGGSPSSVVMADINGDGRPDAAAANTGSNNVAVLLNDGNWQSPPPPPPPVLSISDVSRAEGKTGTTPFTFTVSLSSPAAQPVQVSYATATGSATASGGTRDYQSITGTLTFPAGVTKQMVSVSVIGDTRNESDETFFVNLSQPANATIADGQGVGVILNDDGGRGKSWVGPASGGNWTTAANWSPTGVPTADSLVTISGAAVTLPASATVSEVSLQAGATLTVAPNGNRVLRTAGLFFDAADATLNLGDNDMILDYAPGSSPLGSCAGPAGYDGVSGLIARGCNFGSWDGSGIVTKAAAATAGLTTLAAAEASGSLGLAGGETTLWQGQTVDATTVLVKYTYAGDANLDGVIDGGDYGIIDNFVQTPGADGYFNGDFNFDGVIDGGDYGIIDNNIQAQDARL